MRARPPKNDYNSHFGHFGLSSAQHVCMWPCSECCVTARAWYAVDLDERLPAPETISRPDRLNMECESSIEFNLPSSSPSPPSSSIGRSDREVGSESDRRNMTSERSSLYGSTSTGLIMTKLATFRRRRAFERYRRFRPLVRFGGSLAMAGGLLLALMLAILWAGAVGLVETLYGSAAAAGCICCGLLLLTACPVDAVDLDERLSANYRARLLVGTVLVLLSGAAAYGRPHAHAAPTAAALVLFLPQPETPEEKDEMGGTMMTSSMAPMTSSMASMTSMASSRRASDDANVVRQGTLERWREQLRPCRILTVWLNLFMLATCGWCAYFVANPGKHAEATQGSPSAVVALQGLAGGLGAALLAIAAVLDSTNDLCATTRFYFTMYASTIVLGLLCFVSGALCGCDVGHPVAVAGAALMLPTLVLFALGRDLVFNYLSNKLDQVQSREDGAFIAELLETRQMKAGDPWWIHDDADDAAYELYDPRRNWVLGRIDRVAKKSFSVRYVPRDADHASRRSRGWLDSLRSSPSSGTRRSSGTDRSFSTRIRRGSLARAGAIPLELLKGNRGSRVDPREVSTTIHMMARGGSAAVLLRKAALDLRCLDWEKVSLELLTSDRQRLLDIPPDTPDEGSYIELATNTFDLSRPPRDGEVIDFFLSHSWHDNAKDKWEKLSQFAKAFKSLHGRYPTIWLDKVCIDQNNIAEGLRVLPVNVTACAKMLVLCGPTYPERLWCAWELCTLFSFLSMEAALARIVLLPIDSTAFGEPQETSSLEKLQRFDVAEARCYDPNEEKVLRKIIGAVGKDHFNMRIRELGRACDCVGRRSFARFRTGLRALSQVSTAGARVSAARVSVGSCLASPTSPQPN